MKMKKVSLFSAFLLAVLLVTVGTVAADDNRNFRAHLNGDGAGVETLAQGQAIFQFSKDGEALHYKLIVADLDNLVAAHIHLAAEPGGNGAPVLGLFPGASPGAGDGTSNGVVAEGVATADDLVGLLSGQTLHDLRVGMEAGLTYVNVHTNDFMDPPNTGPGDFPGGEIRGTIK
jgi:hypothetical protein